MQTRASEFDHTQMRLLNLVLTPHPRSLRHGTAEIAERRRRPVRYVAIDVGGAIRLRMSGAWQCQPLTTPAGVVRLDESQAFIEDGVAGVFQNGVHPEGIADANVVNSPGDSEVECHCTGAEPGRRYRLLRIQRPHTAQPSPNCSASSWCGIFTVILSTAAAFRRHKSLFRRATGTQIR